MKLRRALKVVIALASAGWVAPLWLAASLYSSYVTQDLLPRLQGHYTLNSFPTLQAATTLVHFALAWLGAVITGWAYWLLSRDRSRGGA